MSHLSPLRADISQAGFDILVLIFLKQVLIF